ncbi:MAG: HlyC/CorC family transporter [Planctomycetes bacterium]|nr:HlyC/CorC family transporter [Planctomycetota bacterium]
MSIGSWMVLAMLVVCSFLVSGAETALFTLSPRQLRLFAHSSSTLKQSAERLMRHPRRVLMTVLIVNTAVNIAIFSVSFLALQPDASEHPILAALGGIAALLVVLVFGEIAPKAIALGNAVRIAPLVAPLITILEWITLPLSTVLRVLLVEPIVRLVAPNQVDSPTVSPHDLRALVELSGKQGIIDPREHDMLLGVVSLPSIAVRAIMVPRVDIRAVPLDVDRSEAKKLFMETGLKKVPVYGTNIDDIRGLLYARDLYLRPSESIEDLLKPLHFVPEMINLAQLTENFISRKTPLLIVVDEVGGVSGLVALKDLFRKIVGEFDHAGGDTTTQAVETLDERTHRISGSLGVGPWKDAFVTARNLANVDTMGGLVLSLLGRLPKEGDAVRIGNIKLTVEKLNGRRIEQIIVHAEVEDLDHLRNEIAP